MASRYDPATCSHPSPAAVSKKCWRKMFIKASDVAKQTKIWRQRFGGVVVANGGALAEEIGNSASWQSLDLLPNFPFPSTSRHVIVGQYQSIGLLDAQPTTWMLNWQTSAVHHCRPKQPVKPRARPPFPQSSSSFQIVLKKSFKFKMSSQKNNNQLI